MKASTLKVVALASIVGGSLISTGAAADTTDLYKSSKELRAVETSIPEYPRRAELSGVEGYTVVEFTVMPDGTVSEPAIAESSYRAFSRAALAAIGDWKFEPVIAAAGEAVPVRTSMKFSFVGLE
ncbi:energy transducer TonB [Gammaproteobacteria bacterium LSUCC0112]|nr:energy transducer TonB [Gammaproteobacteria bacterium LSUCC0112]